MRQVVWGAGLGVLVAVIGTGCTTKTMVTFPDAGELDAAAIDAGPMEEMDGGIRLPPPTRETCIEAGSTVGDSCSSDAACDDGCFCNGAERCSDSVCVLGDDPCVDAFDCTADSCIEEVNRCVFDPQAEMCSDGDACNGAEQCDLIRGCIPSAPLYCNDENSCTVDSCDTEMGCVFTARDLDGDGYTDGRCGGEDCDDDPRFGTNIHPGAPEICDNRRDDDCDGTRDFNDDDCVPENDTCATATVLSGAGTYSGATRSLRDDYTLSCTSRGGADAVFRFTLTDVRNVTITVAGGGSGTAVSLRRFADCERGPDARCNDGSPPSVIRRSLPAGEYAIIVQTPTANPFDLSLRLEDPTPDPPADTCDSAIDITSMSGSANIADLLEDTLPSCTSSFGTYRDAYFYFDLAAEQDVTVSTSDGTNHYISLQTACGDVSTETRCWNGSGTPRETWRSLPAGRYYVSVGTRQTTGTVNASVDIRPPTPIPPNDRCTGAIMLANGVSRMDTTIDFADDVRGGSCAGTSRPDAYYIFTLSTRQRGVISVSDGDGGSTRFYLTARTGCGSPSDSSSIACTSGNGSATLNHIFDPGTYYLLVETSSSDTSDYTISSAFFPP